MKKKKKNRLKSNSTVTSGSIIDLDIEQFKKDISKMPLGQVCSLIVYLEASYNAVSKMFNDLTTAAQDKSKSEEEVRECIETAKQVNVQMFKLEQKVLFLKERKESLRSFDKH